jgi:ATP phosphoribosyltransferase regulatory subunit
MNQVLLPAGFYDALAPEAEAEADAVNKMLQCFADFGYRRVAPPLAEFEETLLAGPGASLNRSTFRVMDPESQRMLGLRTDHTLQVARIAATRLADALRPLRLSYAGPVLRLQGRQDDPARQAMQVGVELIGSLEQTADAEVIALALSALRRIGVPDVSVDLLLPTLITSLCDAEKLDDATRAELHHALDRKDEAAVQKLAQGKGGKAAALAYELLRASGAAAEAMPLLKKMNLPQAAQGDVARLEAVVKALGDAVPVTVDLVEFRAFQYQTGLSFSLFSKSARQELGRGGRYRTPSGEAATGFTFYAERLMDALPQAKARARLLVPVGLAAGDADKWIAEGYVLVSALGGAPDKAEAEMQGCAGFLRDGQIVRRI